MSDVTAAGAAASTDPPRGLGHFLPLPQPGRRALGAGSCRGQAAAERPRLTRTGAGMGTPAYMPPEQAGEGGTAVDARSDVYALGATLYHVLTRRPPFSGESEVNVLTAVLTKEPPAP